MKSEREGEREEQILAGDSSRLPRWKSLLAPLPLALSLLAPTSRLLHRTPPAAAPPGRPACVVSDWLFTPTPPAHTHITHTQHSMKDLPNF